MKPQSMEEKISYRLFFMGFVGLVCTAVLCLFVFHKAFREQAWTSLEHQADLVSAGYEQLSSPDQLSVFVNGDLRITLIAADGSVVFESATDQQMENHLSRPEIQQAMREGVGRNCRDSQTMGTRPTITPCCCPAAISCVWPRILRPSGRFTTRPCPPSS